MPDSDIQRLVERIEGASGQDRELDALIAVAASKEPTARVAYMAGRRWYKKPGAGRVPFAGAFGTGAALGMIFQDCRYTASIDSAMTLVPEGCAVDLTIWEGRNRARVLPIYHDEAGDRWLHRGSDPDFCTNAATPALALASAALRARITERTDDE